MEQPRKRNTPGNVGKTTTSIVDAGTLMTRGQEGNVRRPKCVWPLVGALLGVAFLLGGAGGGATVPVASAKPVVYVAPILGRIDLGLVPYVDRVLVEAAVLIWCSAECREAVRMPRRGNQDRLAGERPGVHEYARIRKSRVAMVISTLRIVTAPRFRAEIIRTLAAQLGPVRVQPGCLGCALQQDIETPEAVTLTEEWESQAELDLRLHSEEYRAVLAAIELSQEQPVIHFDTVTRRAGLEVVVSARGA